VALIRNRSIILLLAVVWLVGWSERVRACETALVLAIDVSNSVDEGEYRLQVDGLADALNDPEIIDVILTEEAQLAVVQWSGTDMQMLSLDWTGFQSRTEIESFALDVRSLPRAFRLSGTAPAEAVLFALGLFDRVADCKRHVIDLSGDGVSNAGGDVRQARRQAEVQGVTINGIAIEAMGVALTTYYRQSIVTTDGFVITANGHRDYPMAIRTKLLRELSRVLG
jgi:Ca-activated chloride channel family protein